MKYDRENFDIFQPVFFPELTDESAWEIHGYLQNLLEAFESRYYGQLRRYEQSFKKPDIPDWMTDDEVPF